MRRINEAKVEDFFNIPPSGNVVQMPVRPRVQWRVVAGLPRYEVSDDGRVRNVETGKILKPGVGQRGAPSVDLIIRREGQRLGGRRQLARLVCEAFHGPAKGRTPVHLDGDVWNCKASNVVWGHPLIRLDPDQVVSIRRLFVDGHSFSEIGRMFGVGHSAISVILHGRYHRDVVSEYDAAVTKRLMLIRLERLQMRLAKVQQAVAEMIESVKAT